MLIDFSGIDASAAYKWMTATISPRPIAWVSSIDRDGASNLAPFSFFQMITSRPPTLMISPLAQRHGRLKDTVENIRATGEFVVNLVSFELAAAMNQTSANFDHTVDEFAACGITPEQSQFVKPKRVALAPASFECKLASITPYPAENPSCHIILGQVLAMHIDDNYLNASGLPAIEKLNLISRMGGDWYGQTISPNNFELPRPE